MKLWRRKEKSKTQIRYFPKQQMNCYEQNTILLVCPIRYKFLIHTVENMIHFKVLMQGKLIAVHIEPSSLWTDFVNKNRCLSVRLVSEEVKSIKF